MKIFKETQSFTQSWFVALIAISVLVPIAIFTKEFLKENSEIDTIQFMLFIFLTLGSILPIFFFKLKTRIDEKGVHFKFSPFHRSFRSLTWKEIKTIEIRKYDALSEYGGWGVKGGFLWKRKSGVAYNVKGNIGIQLTLTNDKKILIGTQKQEEVNRVLKNYNPENNL